MTKEQIEVTFAALERAAAAGARCPFSRSFDMKDGVPTQAVIALARAGRVALEISSLNWRVVTVLTGPHKGKSTAPNPLKKSRVYKTIDASGTRVNGRLVDHGAASRPQPSLPRLRFQDGA